MIRKALAEAWWLLGTLLIDVKDAGEPEPEAEPRVVYVPVPVPVALAMHVFPADSAPARTYVAAMVPDVQRDEEDEEWPAGG